jgi:hypothetical protein
LVGFYNAHGSQTPTTALSDTTPETARVHSDTTYYHRE